MPVHNVITEEFKAYIFERVAARNLKLKEALPEIAKRLNTTVQYIEKLHPEYVECSYCECGELEEDHRDLGMFSKARGYCWASECRSFRHARTESKVRIEINVTANLEK